MTDRNCAQESTVTLSYREDPGSLTERAARLALSALPNGDLLLEVENTDATGHRSVASFHVRMSGGFEDSHPKTLQKLSELYRVLQAEGRGQR